MLIRSAASDGKFSNSVYTVASTNPLSFDEDIVCSDGFFVSWPQVTPAG